MGSLQNLTRTVQIGQLLHGGPDDDAVYGCAVDATGNFYFTGTSLSITGIASSGVE